MLIRRLLGYLLATALLLPIALVIVAAVARVLEGMQDQAGAAALDRVALGMLVAWLVDLAALVVVQAVVTLGPPNGPPPSGT